MYRTVFHKVCEYFHEQIKRDNDTLWHMPMKNEIDVLFYMLLFNIIKQVSYFTLDRKYNAEFIIFGVFFFSQKYFYEKNRSVTIFKMVPTLSLI